MAQVSIKVGVIAEQTGALSFMGGANANVAKMVVDDINADGGLLGRQIDLYLEDGATTDSVAAAAATKLVERDKVDVIFGGIYSSTRQAIKGPAVEKGGTLSISTRSSTRGRKATPSSSAPARCRRSSSIRSFPG